MDVLGVAVDGEEATVARLRAENGQLVDRDRHRLTGVPAGDRVAALEAFLPQFYAERELPDVVLTPVPVEDDDRRAWLESEGVELSATGAGRRGRLVDLATKNARRGRSTDGVGALADRLGHPVDRVEGFDVSHTGGADVVGSDVTFVDGDPRKADYRRKGLPDGDDDPASMRALLQWRAERAVEGRDDRPDPDLLVIDGGREQLRAARETLDAVGWDRPLVGVAKGEDRDSDRALDVDGPLGWDRDAPATRLLRRVRDEAHRFAVDYHRTVRDEVSTALDDVPGVGPATRKKLLRRFGGVEGVRTASREELTAVDGVGERTAERVERRL
jgi:Excinuclease ABC subunit C